MATTTSTRPRAPTLQTLPEELLEKILVHALVPPAPRRARSSTTAALAALSPVKPAPAPRPASPPGALLTSRTLARIGAPLALRDADVRAPGQARALLAALRADPARGTHVRALALGDTLDPAVPALLALCPRLEGLDLQLPTDLPEDGAAPAEQLARALASLRHIKTLTVRKGAYLTEPGARAALAAVAAAVPTWPALDTATLAFRLPTTSCPALSALLAALAQAPSLHTVRTCLPSVWSSSLLALALNPTLARIVLASSEHTAFTPADAPLSPRSLWLRAARAHPRLFALVRAGSVLARERARTTVGPAPVFEDECDTEPDSARSLAPTAGSRPTRALSTSMLDHA